MKYKDETIENQYIDELPLHSYDWTYLEEHNDKKQYNYSNIKAKLGIDVSKYQGEIDWKQVKDENIDFAILRVGYRGYETGNIKEDPTFTYNVTSANKVGLDVGVYFFSQAISPEEAKEEAAFVLQQIKKHDVTYPVVFDLEFIEGNDRISHLTKDEITEITKAFCEEIEQVGYQVMIYGNRHWLQDVIELGDLSTYDIWLAEYREEPSYPYEFKMWQYTDNGSVAGISGGVDMNLWFDEISEVQ
nr:glycoside hydrolase family 25 protein [Holtiella tumoricola]